MDAARAHQARIRDKDGSSFVLLPEHRLVALETLTAVAVNLTTLERARSIRNDAIDLVDYGEWTWLEHLDSDDLAEFVTEVRESFIRAIREHDATPLVTLLDDWRTTARVLADGERRDVLLSSPALDDFVDARRPEPGNAA